MIQKNRTLEGKNRTLEGDGGGFKNLKNRRTSLMDDPKPEQQLLQLSYSNIFSFKHESHHKIKRTEKFSSCTKIGVFFYSWQLRKKHHFWCSQKTFRPFLFCDGFSRRNFCLVEQENSTKKSCVGKVENLLKIVKRSGLINRDLR